MFPLRVRHVMRRREDNHTIIDADTFADHDFLVKGQLDLANERVRTD